MTPQINGGSMRILVDRQKCQGYGNCVLAAPEDFDLGADDKVVVLEPGSQDLAQLKRAERDCPAKALLVQDDR